MERLEEVTRQIESAGGRAFARAADVSIEPEMTAFVGDAVARFGGLDVMICNAGFGVAGSVDDVTPEAMRKLVDVNFMGTYYAARAALPVFRGQGRGHLIIVSSIVGKRGVPYMGAYSATKFAQVGLAECLRAELQGSNIHVTVVYPVSTDTEFFEVMSRETGAQVERAFGPRQSVDRVAEAIARAIEHPVPEVYPYAQSRALVWLNALAPGFCDRIANRFGRRPIR